MIDLLKYVAWGCFAGAAAVTGGIFFFIWLELKKERDAFTQEVEKEHAASIEDIRRRNNDSSLAELVSADNNARSTGNRTSDPKKG